MKVRITAGENVFLIADQTSAISNHGTYQNRLLNELSLDEQLNALGTAPVTISLNVRNDDLFIGFNVDLWAADVLVTANNGRSWAGKVTAWDNDENSILNIEVTEKTAPELKFYFPDEINRIYSIDENFHYSAVNATLPMAIGGNDANPLRLTGLLINTEEGIYGFCGGEIHKFVGIRVGGETLSVSEANERGYATFTGSPSQENYPGMVYLQITNEDLRKNDDGTYVEIGAELVGLKFGAHTIEECRNGARALYWLMKTPSTGAGGWGLGINSSDINSDAINAAINAVDTANLKLDGVLYFKQIAMSWIRQICQAIRATYSIGADGLRSVFVDAPASSIKTYTANNMRLLNYGKGAFTGRVYNLGELDYGYNSITGVFMQRAQYQNSPSIAQIEEQKFYGQSYLINDAATAQAIVEYSCKRSLIAAYKVLFETDDLPSGAKKGSVITIDRLEKGITGLYQISKLKITDHIHVVEAEKYDVNSFVVGGTGTKIDWTEELPVVSVVSPGVASGLSLSSEVRPSPDGTNLIVLKGTFTPPAGGYLAASIDYGKGILPILSWTDLGLMRGESFEIPGVQAGQAYAVRIRMISANSKSPSYITATITTQGDTVPPGKPAISATSSLKNVSINLSLASVPSDMAGFQIFRNTTNNSGTATRIGYVESSKGTAQTVDINTEYGSTYYYWAKAVDTWGNPSVFSDAFGPLTIGMILSEDVSPEAIKQAIGSVASWSAKNCTTASIAEANGVKDVSGNGNHGRAYGGVAVVDTELGKAFDFSGTRRILGSFAPGALSGLTLSAWVRLDADVSALRMIVSIGGAYLGLNTAKRIYFFAATGLFSEANLINASSWHLLTATHNGTTASIYLNGLMIASADFAMSINPTNFAIGNHTSSDLYAPDGQIFDPRIYSRALSATEVKSLYMFPGDVAFGRITSDLVTTGELITLSAQIANAIINDAHINTLNAAKINAGFLDVARIENDSLTSSKILVGKCGAALNDDPNFEDPSAWGAFPVYPSYYTSTIVTVTDGAVGSKAMRSNGYSIFGTLKTFPIDIGKSYRLSAKARRSPTATGVLYLAAQCLNASGADIGYKYFVSGVALTTSWATKLGTFSGAAAFPAGTAFVRLYALANYGGSAGTYCEIQDFRIEEAVSTTLIEDGAVTTTKLNTNAIKSLNYSTTAGSFLNLADGKFIVGGSTSPVFTIDAAAKTGKISGFSFNTTDLTAGASTTAIGISTDTAKRAFWAGGTTPTTAPFQIKHDGTGKMAGFAFTAAGMQSTATFSTVVYDTIIYATTSGTANGLKNTRTVSATNYSYVEISAGGLYAKSVTSGNTSYVQINGTNLLYAGVPSSSDTAIATNGKIYAAGSFFPTSDERCKSDIVDVSVLDGVKKLKVKKYHLDDYKIARIWREKQIEKNIKERNMVAADSTLCLEPDIENYNPCKSIGVLAADFNTVFNIGNGNIETYNLTDGIGVALRAIQELAEIVDEQNAEIAELRAALSLSPKPKKEKPEIEELTDEEREYIRLSEELTDEQREQIWREYERHMDSKK